MCEHGLFEVHATVLEGLALGFVYGNSIGDLDGKLPPAEYKRQLAGGAPEWDPWQEESLPTRRSGDDADVQHACGCAEHDTPNAIADAPLFVEVAEDNDYHTASEMQGMRRHAVGL